MQYCLSLLVYRSCVLAQPTVLRPVEVETYDLCHRNTFRARKSTIDYCQGLEFVLGKGVPRRD